MNGIRETIALPAAFLVSVGVLILFDYVAVSAMADAIDFVKALFG